jgi:signal transduction histidine kinase
MRFGRRPEPDPGVGSLPPTPGERLVRRTRAGLAVFTLALIAILLGVVGLVTAAAVVQMTDLSVDQNLHAASENMLSALEPKPTPTPTPTPTPAITPSVTPEPTEVTPTSSVDEPGPSEDPRASGSDEGGAGGEGEGRPTPAGPPTITPTAAPSPTATPAATPTPTATPLPTASPTAVPTGTPVATAGAVEDRPPGSSDTFFLVLDTSGKVVSNPQAVQLTGLPNQAAASVAAAGVEDWRTVTADGVQVRLLTEPMHALDGSVFGVLQSGFKLTAYDDQKALIVRTIFVTSLIGLLGAALVTLVVTRRAMSPIRAAFDAERRFVASASHELRTPVAVVRASAEILQREGLVKPEGRHLVDDVVAESDRLGRLVGDLLALASAEAGQISISATVFDIRPLIDEVVDRVAGIASERGVRIEAVQERAGESAEGELLVHADRERMLQLLVIFLDNAIDHSPSNGLVRVVARPADDVPRAGRRVVVEVLDQGPGVPLEDRERIFEPFARVSGRRRTTGTTGLGLAIARILAARQNATLAVRDAPGGGACFSVSLARRPPTGSPSSS